MKVEYIDHMGNDASVVKAARVSFAQDKELRTLKQDTKLINYLSTHKHWSPFSHTSITLRMTAPIPIRTQCFKHKVGFTENEESRRYIDYTPEYFLPEFRYACTNKKQGSGEVITNSLQFQSKDVYERCVKNCIYIYEEMLRAGVAEEQARFVLPQGCMVNWYWTGSLSSFARFYNQRSDPHAQKEIQDLASMVSDIIKPLYPISWKALTEV
jgi:thymidylate synthase (FAD)